MYWAISSLETELSLREALTRASRSNSSTVSACISCIDLPFEEAGDISRAVCIPEDGVDGALWSEDIPPAPGEGMAASSAKSATEVAGDGIWWVIGMGLETGRPWMELALCISAVMGVRGKEKLWDLVGVWSFVYIDKSKELFMGVVSGVRGEPLSVKGISNRSRGFF